jgi:glycerol-3-phosphate acyltransferase PlsY
MVAAPLVVWWFWPAPELIGMSVLMTILLFWRHRGNIRHLIEGSEDRIGTDQDSS